MEMYSHKGKKSKNTRQNYSQSRRMFSRRKHAVVEAIYGYNKQSKEGPQVETHSQGKNNSTRKPTRSQQ